MVVFEEVFDLLQRMPRLGVIRLNESVTIFRPKVVSLDPRFIVTGVGIKQPSVWIELPLYGAASWITKWINGEMEWGVIEDGFGSKRRNIVTDKEKVLYDVFSNV